VDGASRGRAQNSSQHAQKSLLPLDPTENPEGRTVLQYYTISVQDRGNWETSD
jgi:hypothetical protein